MISFLNKLGQQANFKTVTIPSIPSPVRTPTLFPLNKALREDLCIIVDSCFQFMALFQTVHHP